ncbi:cytochrome c oxidase subunit 3 [Dongia mobilis]|uniref:Cytochrome c oxidase subunit 3 n=1 Tax=Dongia mobilis TaxID=578943 RepID=A0A4R6WSF7_9PROT|nr:cytochrome c oxidase subunit 3 [Dongia mobilis]TDQ82411.1 cytochrome c oxidase subunit 3 [Dongia mobilis]
MSDAAAHKPNHPYHLVDPSPWPLVGSIAGGVFTIGMVFYMHGKAGFLVSVLPGIVLILLTMLGWWRDVVKEAEIDKAHSPVVQIGLRYGMALFIASEVMFFVAFFWAFFDASLFPKDAVGGVWPPQGVLVLDPLQIPLLNTLILLLSGCTVTWAHHALREGDRQNFIRGLALTILLGIIFTGFQAYEYAHAPFGFKDGIYSSTFYMATGFHGFHVLVGTLFLIVCLFRGFKGHFTPDHHFGFEAAAWYWHFVDVVWLFLFAWIYIWGSGPGPYYGA